MWYSDSNGNGLSNFQRTENLDERNDCLSNGYVFEFWKTLNLEFWIDLCWRMLKNGLKAAQNGSKDFVNFVNLYETNCCLSDGSGPMFWKILDLELWIDSGWFQNFPVFYLKTCIFSLKLDAHFSITTLPFDFWPFLNESSSTPEKKHPKVIGVKHAYAYAIFAWSGGTLPPPS